MSAADPFGYDDPDEFDEITGETPLGDRRSAGAVIIPIAALLIAVYLEIALSIDARVLGAVPDLALIVIVAIALRFGPVSGALAGFAAGLLIDVSVQGPLGASALVLTPIGWATGLWADRCRRVSLGMAIGVLFVATVVALVGDAIVTVTIENQDVAWGTFAVRALAQIAFTLLIGIALLPLLRRCTGVPERGRA